LLKMYNGCPQQSGKIESDHCCHQHQSNPSVHQSLDELDFERGIWGSALAGDFDDVKQKLSADTSGFVANKADKSGYSPLHYSSRSGHIEICKLLLSRGAKVNVKTNSSGATALHRAAYMGHSQVVSLLVYHGADPLALDCDGMTPLHKAAENGSEETVIILVKANSSALTLVDKKGRNPESIAKCETLRRYFKNI